MRKFGVIIFSFFLTISTFAEEKDSTTIRAYLYNNKYEVYLNINL